MKYKFTYQYDNYQIYPCQVYVSDADDNPLFCKCGKTFGEAKDDALAALKVNNTQPLVPENEEIDL